MAPSNSNPVNANSDRPGWLEKTWLGYTAISSAFMGLANFTVSFISLLFPLLPLLLLHDGPVPHKMHFLILISKLLKTQLPMAVLNSGTTNRGGGSIGKLFESTLSQLESAEKAVVDSAASSSSSPAPSNTNTSSSSPSSPYASAVSPSLAMTPSMNAQLLNDRVETAKESECWEFLSFSQSSFYQNHMFNSNVHIYT
jgi:hypothetical protein